MRLRYLIAGVVIFLAIPGFALGITVAGYHLKDTIKYSNKTLRLNGYAVRTATIFAIKVYIGAFYTEKPLRSYRAVVDDKNPKVIFMHFLRSVSHSQFRDAFIDDFKYSNPQGVEKTWYVKKFMELFKNSIKSGEDISIVLLPERQCVVVLIDGRKVGKVRSGALIRAIERVFVGPRPAKGYLKKGFLGLK